MGLLIDSFLSFSVYVLPFLIILTVIVFVHELGHYLAARYNDVRVEVFSIGFGHELFGYTDRRGTRWKFGIIPLGGYVRMFGEVDFSTKGHSLSYEECRSSFRHKRLSQRAVIISAGPVMNFVFAIMVFASVFMILGEPVIPPVVGDVKPGSAAAIAGIRPGDRFVTIDDHDIEQFADIQRYVQLSNGAPLEIHLQRDRIELILKITPQVIEGVDYLGNTRYFPVLGVGMNPNEPSRTRYHTPFSALGQALHETYEVTHTTLIAFGQMLIGARDTGELSGVLRIAHFSGMAAKGGTPTFITFIAVLSINLGVVNLFPIPLLDGGYLLFYLVEGIRGRPLTEKMQEYSLRIGMALILGLMVFATWNDLVQLRIWEFFADLVS